MPKKQLKFLIIDSNALIHRAFHALPPTLTDSQGRPTNAVYGFTTILLKAIKDLKPDYLAACFDRREKTFRHEQFEAYKAHRAKAPDELYEQIPLVKEVLESFGIPVFEKAGFEADDLIGTISHLKSVDRPDIETIIVTGDQDTFQLVDDNTKVLTPHKGLGETVIYDEKMVSEKFGGLQPEQLIDYKGLRGDVSDNISGVKGIGEKGAIELLLNFGTIENIYKNIDSKKIKDRTRELLKQQEKEALMSKHLATIVREAPIDFDLDECRFQGFDMQKVIGVFQNLSFKRLMSQLQTLGNEKKIKVAGGQGDLFASSTSFRGSEATVGIPLSKSGSSAAIPNSSSVIPAQAGIQAQSNNGPIKKAGEQYILVSGQAEIKKFISELKKQKEFCFDTETTGLDPFDSELVGASFCWEKGVAHYLPAEAVKQAKEELSVILADQKIKKIGHNLKFDIEVMGESGFEIKGIYFDTMVASYLLNPGNRQNSLDTLAFVELGYQMQPIEELIGKGKDQCCMSDVACEKVCWYACEDADFTWQLYEKFKPELEKEKMDKLFHELEMPLVSVLAQMERNGVKVDGESLSELSKEYGKKIKAVEKKIWKLVGEEFNVASPIQLKQALFEKMGIDGSSLHKTKSGISTGAAELEKLLGWLEENNESKDKIKVVESVLEFRELSKLKNTYLDALPKLINPHDKRVHTSFNQTVTVTGRLSSSDPNLQNIPIRTEESRLIRRAFVADKGCKLIKADYSQIELRIVASLADDKEMLEIFRTNGDIHTSTAAFVNEVDESEVTKEMRRQAKEVNFGVLYGMGAWGLSQRTGLSAARAQEFITKYFVKYSGVKKYIADVIASAEEKGYVETLYGRRRPIPEIGSSIQQVRNAAERTAINMPVQGCLPSHVKILTSAGYIAIGELFKNKKRPKKVWDGANWQKYEVLNRGKAQLAQIVFSNNQVLDCDTRHEILCLNDRGYFWKKFKELKNGDKVCFSYPEVFEFGDKPKKIDFSYNKNRQAFKIKNPDERFWYWLGYFYGDGHYTERNCTRAIRHDLAYTFGSHQEKKLRECEKYFIELGLNPRPRKIPPSTPKANYKWELMITSIGWGKFLQSIGVTSNENAHTKRILPRIFQETKENRIAFIKGFFEADGYMGKTYKYMPNFHLCQKEILSDLQLLLRTLGIESSLLGPYKYGGQTSFRLDMLRNSFQKNIYGKNIKPSYRTACKAPKFIIHEILKKYPNLTAKKLQTGSDYVLYNRWKNGGHSTTHHIKDWLERNNVKIGSPLYSWYQVKDIKAKKQKETTYTLSVENSHRFDSEGVISKNTAADLIKLAMVAIQDGLAGISPKSRMLLQVHDELVFEVPEKDVKKVATFVREKMCEAIKLKAPIEVEVSVGDNWGETEKL